MTRTTIRTDSSFSSDRSWDLQAGARIDLLARDGVLSLDDLRGDTHVSRGAAADACARFCRGLVDAVAPYVVGVKLQLAFFEALGADGLRAFEDTCSYARTAGLLVVGCDDGHLYAFRAKGP